MSLLQKAARQIPAIRRLHDSRNSLLAERDSLAGQLLRLEQETAAMRAASSEARLFITDYAYNPQQRPIDQCAGGLQIIHRLNAEAHQYADVLGGIAKHCEALLRIPRDEQDQTTPFWSNAWFPPFDGAALYGLIAERAPRRYIEVGSGNSTRFARQAVRDMGLDTKIVSIDPQPRIEIDRLCDEIVRKPMEDVPSAFWESIGPDDLLFVDNSHRSFSNSDVTVFFTEIMPALQPGVTWGLHDIFLPGDYPQAWRGRFYNEQYLLFTYLLGGAECDEIVLPLTWASQQSRLHGILEPLWLHEHLFRTAGTHGVSFWMRKRAKS